ncbi:hypothetical protein FSARC_227 [Fusarium sarcochroum]|uniref:DUF7703 domain-containing protein n=1 Tax=Fusarium sarcochroum TaxID=1208366 RepID=A0A8H4UCJ3_9HYPO|nr:hypothetical protein FSARC_227 [Fusarium sarcochroum]
MTLSIGRLAPRGSDPSYNLDSVLIIICLALTYFNTAELLVAIYFRFKVQSGLYFWSMLLATLALLPFCLGFMLEDFGIIPKYAGIAINCVGWIFMVSGQSFVLYSRLRLLLYSVPILRAVLCMIITNAILWHPSTIALHYASLYAPPSTIEGCKTVFGVIEKVQMVCFCIQEFTLSGLYIWRAADFQRTSFHRQKHFLWRLICTNIIIVLLDVALLVVEFRNLDDVQRGFKPLVYSIKLKLEIAVLNELVSSVEPGGGGHSSCAHQHDVSDFVVLSEVHR